MTVRVLPTSSADAAHRVLLAAAAGFRSVPSASGDGFEKYNSYLRAASEQLRMLSSVLLPSEVDRLLATPRYWMLHSIDPVGKAPVLNPLLDVEIDEKVRTLEAAAASIVEDINRYSHADAVVVPDTNVLLHHRHELDKIPWAEFAPAVERRVIVAIPVTVIDELDRAKRRNGTSEGGGVSVRNRARRTLAILERWFSKDFFVEFRDSEPVVEFVLVLDGVTRTADADLAIIDAAATIKVLSPAPTYLVTNDTGMRLRARAAGIDATRPPDELGPDGAAGGGPAPSRTTE